MLLSTAIPIVIAAIVIVIMSKGIPNKPIIPSIKKAAIKFGITPINESLIFLNKIMNIENGTDKDIFVNSFLLNKQIWCCGNIRYYNAI